MNLETAHVLCGRSIGCPAQEGCEVLDVTDIVGLGLLAEPTDNHVLKHAAAKFADGLLTYR